MNINNGNQNNDYGQKNYNNNNQNDLTNQKLNNKNLHGVVNNSYIYKNSNPNNYNYNNLNPKTYDVNNNLINLYDKAGYTNYKVNQFKVSQNNNKVNTSSIKGQNVQNNCGQVNQINCGNNNITNSLYNNQNINNNQFQNNNENINGQVNPSFNNQNNNYNQAQNNNNNNNNKNNIINMDIDLNNLGITPGEDKTQLENYYRERFKEKNQKEINNINNNLLSNQQSNSDNNESSQTIPSSIELNDSNKYGMTPGEDKLQLEQEKSINNPFNNQQPNYKNNESNQIAFSFDLYKKPSLVALENVGNISYMNAVVRILSNVKSIVIYYLKQLNNIKNMVGKIPLSYSFSRIIFHLYPYPQNSLENSYSLQSFHKVVIYLNPIYKGHSTKNAVDFSFFLLDLLHKEDLSFRNINNKEKNEIQSNTNFDDYIVYLKNNEDSIIFSSFGYIYEKEKICINCRETNITYQNYFTYDLDIQRNLEKLIVSSKKEVYIYDFLKNCMDKENLYNVYCEKCKQKSNFESKSFIRSSPNYFIFLLRLDEISNIKKLVEHQIKIKIDEQIDISEFIKGNQPNVQYNLRGFVVVNYKSNIEKEYKAFCCSPIDQKWYMYENDGKSIIKIEKNDYLNSNNLFPVILLYKINN